jgi:hypothetical membrane protein
MRSRKLAALAAIGPPLFLAITVFAGLIKPGYDISEQTVSDLAVGAHGWIQTANFLLLGASVLAFALVLRSRRGVAFAIAGAGLIASGIYPGDLPGAVETSHGAIHNMLAVVIFFALTAGLALHRAKRLALAVFVLLVTFALFAGDVGDPLHGISGLLERVLIALPLVWIAVSARQQLDAVAPRVGRVEAADAR